MSTQKARGSILLIEDDMLLQDLISLVFSEMGLNVRPVNSLSKLANALSEGPYDAIIIEYALFDGSGTEIIPQLKAKNPRAKIIGMSSLDVSQKFYEAGADLFFRKPFNIVPFAKAIKGLL